MLAEYISDNTLLKKAYNNLEQEIAHLTSDKVDPVSIKEEPTFDKGFNHILTMYKQR